MLENQSLIIISILTILVIIVISLFRKDDKQNNEQK